MGDNATEIDLDSVIDRLLEGTFRLLVSRHIIYECGSYRFGVCPVQLVVVLAHAGLAYHGLMLPHQTPQMPVTGHRRPQKERMLTYLVVCFPLVLKTFGWRHLETRCCFI